MTTPAAYHRSLEALSRIVLDEAALETTAQQIADSAANLLDDAHACGITLPERRGYVTAARTDTVVDVIDRRQYQAGDGPCLDAISHDRVNRLDEAAVARRWPDFHEYAGRHGIRSVLAAPLTAQGEPVAALNVYSTDPVGFRDVDERMLRSYCEAAGVAVANALRFRDAVLLGGQLTEALASRSRIEQAKGVLMARLGCSADEAFERLVRESQQANVKLRDVAARIVASAGDTSDPTLPCPADP